MFRVALVAVSIIGGLLLGFGDDTTAVVVEQDAQATSSKLATSPRQNCGPKWSLAAHPRGEVDFLSDVRSVRASLPAAGFALTSRPAR
jgi:hypothetical protein